MFDLKIVLKIEKEVPEYKYQRSQSSFLHDKRNQAEISGDLMSERKECVRKVKYLNEKFKSKKNSQPQKQREPAQTTTTLPQ